MEEKLLLVLPWTRRIGRPTDKERKKPRHRRSALRRVALHVWAAAPSATGPPLAPSTSASQGTRARATSRSPPACRARAHDAATHDQGNGRDVRHVPRTAPGTRLDSWARSTPEDWIPDSSALGYTVPDRWGPRDGTARKQLLYRYHYRLYSEISARKQTYIYMALFSSPENQKVFKIPSHIESCGTCMKY